MSESRVHPRESSCRWGRSSPILDEKTERQPNVDPGNAAETNLEQLPKRRQVLSRQQTGVSECGRQQHLPVQILLQNAKLAYSIASLLQMIQFTAHRSSVLQY